MSNDLTKKQQSVIKEIFKKLKPKARTNALDFSKKYGFLSPESSAITGRFVPFKYQEEILKAMSDDDIELLVWMKSTRLGYALSLDTEIPTIDGWTTIEDCKIGDTIFDENGNHCEITYKSDIFEDHNCYEITFSDGTIVKADEDHRWFVKSTKAPVLKPNGYHNPKYEGVINTKELFKRHKYGTNNENLFRIENAGPLDCIPKFFPVPPYILGLWLGDGHSVTPKITQHRTDVETAKYMVQEKINIKIKYDDKRYPNNASIYVKNMVKNFKSMGLISMGGPCNTKRIPEIYFRGSIKQRLELLRGLMDSDGTICKKRGRAEFNNTNYNLIKGVYELLVSLGYKAVINKRNTKNKPHHLDQWRVNFKAVQSMNPFNIKRKADLVLKESKPTVTHSRYISNVKKIGTIPTQCISVNSKSELFLCSRSMVPTHNTKLVNFKVAYNIAEDPATILIFQPNDGKANDWSKDELKPLIRDMPIVNEKIIKTREDDTLNKKSFYGGYVSSRGGKAVSNYASATARDVVLDEYSRFPDDVDGEGDPYSLVVKRIESYWNGKVIIGSTPRIKYHDKTEDKFNETDMRFRYVPCPHCNHFQIIEFKNLIIPQEYRDGVKHWETSQTKLKCIKCEELINHRHKKQMDNKGKWRQTQVFYCCSNWQKPKENENWNDDGEALCIHCNLTAEYNRNGRKKRGYHIWAGYSFQPNTTWVKIAEAFVDALGNVEKMKSFKNTWLGETFEEKSVKLDSNNLLEKVEHYEKVPNSAKIILMTVDTQDTWLEYVITAWSPGETSHNITTGKIDGDPINQYVWDELFKISRTKLQKEDGSEAVVYWTFIDMAGHKTDEVKKFVKKYSPLKAQGFTMLKGDSRENKENDARPVSLLRKSSVDESTIMWIATSKAKDIIFKRLTFKQNDIGYIHHNENFNEEWFEQLTAEKKIFKKNKRGFIEETYVKQRERNEALDLMAYQLGAVRLMQQQIKGFDLSIRE